MKKPYIFERRKIAKAQSEDRRDFEDMVQAELKEGEEDGIEAENQSEAQ